MYGEAGVLEVSVLAVPFKTPIQLACLPSRSSHVESVAHTHAR